MPCKQGKGRGIKDITHPDFHLLLAARCSIATEKVPDLEVSAVRGRGRGLLSWEVRPSELRPLEEAPFLTHLEGHCGLPAPGVGGTALRCKVFLPLAPQL